VTLLALYGHNVTLLSLWDGLFGRHLGVPVSADPAVGGVGRGSSAPGVCVGGWRLAGCPALPRAGEAGWAAGSVGRRFPGWVRQVKITETVRLPAIFAGRRTVLAILSRCHPHVPHPPHATGRAAARGVWVLATATRAPQPRHPLRPLVLALFETQPPHQPPLANATGPSGRPARPPTTPPISQQGGNVTLLSLEGVNVTLLALYGHNVTLLSLWDATPWGFSRTVFVFI
jgi:hypothetical protein